jgi:FeS assembly SUF system protein
MSQSSGKDRLPLHVLKKSAKVDELRDAVARDAGAKVQGALQTQTLGDPALIEKVIGSLRGIFDPEIPVNIYDLGLVYRIEISADGAAVIDMTLTSPGCPVAASLVAQVQQGVAAVHGITSATVNLVWEPPWTKGRMSEAAMLELGLF